VDPRDPLASAVLVAELVRGALAEAGLSQPPAALCAGLAGVGNETERLAVENALAHEGVAGRVKIVTDGEIALEGALGGGAGVLIIAGTGSVAFGRGEDGRVERCGGWGMFVGDEGSGYSIGRSGIIAALRAADGRGPDTRLLAELMARMGVHTPNGIPPWVGRVQKGEIAALAERVMQIADAGDAVALELLRREAGELALHPRALAGVLAPWTEPVSVVFHGGTLSSPLYAGMLEEALAGGPHEFRVRRAVADAVAGALALAMR
jgi:glucosamine kinase